MALDRERALAGRHELRPQRNSQLATGTLACPTCDAPVLLAGATGPAEPLACGYCGHDAPARDFLSLEQPTRPARVAVRVRLGLAA
jgi:hypothetical protein